MRLRGDSMEIHGDPSVETPWRSKETHGDSGDWRLRGDSVGSEKPWRLILGTPGVSIIDLQRSLWGSSWISMETPWTPIMENAQ